MNGYNAKGVVWYQGCGDIGRYNEYQSMFNALATTFRRDFGNDELPIYLIQLAPYGADASELRAVQYNIAKDDENTYLVSANTEGTVFTSSDLTNSSVADYFVHTSRKSPIGLRLADSVLKNTYGIAYGTTTAPEIVSVTASGNVLTITFDTNLALLYGNTPEGFEIAGTNGVFYKATATVSGNTILLTSDKVSSPVTVRYGYGAPIILILEDGTRIIPADRFAGSTSDTEKATIVDVNGNTHVFYADEYDVVMSVLGGNITNASGHPLPVFKLSVGYES
jgi:sialate O-acetylesterase